jgi:SAM-dependent methyltransferase
MVSRLECTGPCDVVEFGCGYGTFTIPAAQQITGNVFTFDIDPAMVSATRQRAAALGISNIIAEVRDCLADGTGLADASVGHVMLYNILHIEEPLVLLREAFRILRPGGKLSIIHWRNDLETPRGPSLEIRPTAEQCRAWAESAGFTYFRHVDLCCCSWHWGLVMQHSAEMT